MELYSIGLGKSVDALICKQNGRTWILRRPRLGATGANGYRTVLWWLFGVPRRRPGATGL